MNSNILEQKINTLKTYKIFNKEIIDQFSKILQNSDKWSLLRINPIRFAQIHEFKENECIDLFIHSAKIGIFDFTYNMLCPMCGGVAHSHKELDQLNSDTFYCAACNIHAPSNLDDLVEVSFTVHPSIQNMDLNPLENINNYFRFHFSPNFVKSEQLITLIKSKLKTFLSIDPDETIKYSIDGNNYSQYQFASIENNSTTMIYFGESYSDHDAEIPITALSEGFTPREMHIKKGVYDVIIKNLSKFSIGVLVLTPDFKALEEVSKKYPTKINKFLTGKMLLNNQSFRDLFRVHHLSNSMNLNIKSLTILFTDLRGSTEMYDKAGDPLAYELVQEHFKILTEVVRKNSGAIIKTMGDAIMATFSNSSDGLIAAIEMMKKIDELNLNWKEKGHELGLKVGINEGPALAVLNDERLDYFGQTINIGARVQGLAKAGEIWVSESILNYENSNELLYTNGYKTEKHLTILKGVGQPTIVYRLYKSAMIQIIPTIE